MHGKRNRPNFYPDKCFDSFGVAEIIDYLRKTNNSYLQFQLPNIERHFGALISRSDKNNNLPLLLNLYNEVKEEIVKRINNDNKWFSEILTCVKDISGSISIQIEIAPELENSIEDKLSDLINMFVIHLRGEYDANLCHAVLFAIISLEKDIKQNNRIRNRILYPISVALKNASNN